VSLVTWIHRAGPHQPGDDLSTDIHVINADGSGARNSDQERRGRGLGPAWSADGRQIAWKSGRAARRIRLSHHGGPPSVGVKALPPVRRTRHAQIGVWRPAASWSAFPRPLGQEGLGGDFENEADVYGTGRPVEHAARAGI